MKRLSFPRSGANTCPATTLSRRIMKSRQSTRRPSCHRFQAEGYYSSINSNRHSGMSFYFSFRARTDLTSIVETTAGACSFAMRGLLEISEFEKCELSVRQIVELNRNGPRTEFLRLALYYPRCFHRACKFHCRCFES